MKPLLLCAGLLCCTLMARAADPPADLFRRDNLVAWCIVPFDAKQRGPQARVEMLERLGFRKYAYDWRAEHLPTFDEELRLLKQHGIELTAVWFPTELNADAKTLLALLEKHGVKTQLWVTGGGGPTNTPEEQRQRVQAEARRIRPIADAAAAIGCQVALYNHGGWFGEPENQLAVLAELKLSNVGLVYNQHHGHDHVDRFAALLAQMKPHLLALNLNGMIPQGDRVGQKIVPLGAGSLDLPLLKVVRESGYTGPIGILGHTNDDAEERLSDNLEGLAWLLKQRPGQQVEPLPKYRTYTPPPPPGQVSLVPGKFGNALDARSAGVKLPGRAEYRQPPLTLELCAKLNDPQPYNILVANDLKSSATHWELFSMAGTGKLTVYVPGYQPDHVRSDKAICDDRWHHLAMIFEPQRIRLFVDGELVADQAVKSTNGTSQPGDFAIGQLVDRAFGCKGLIDDVRLSRGVREIRSVPSKPLEREEQTLELWKFDQPGDVPQQAAVSAVEKKPEKNHWGKEVVGFDWTEQDSVDGRWSQTDVGPFLASVLPLPGGPMVAKGLSIRLGTNQQNAVCYDTAQLQWRAAWTGEFLKYNPARYGLIGPPTMAGDVLFSTSDGPGWRVEGDESRSTLRHRGLRLSGDTVVLEATVGQTILREVPGAQLVAEGTVFTRDIEVGATTETLRLQLGPFRETVKSTIANERPGVLISHGGRTLAATVVGDADLQWQVDGKTAALVIPPRAQPRRLRVSLWPTRTADLAKSAVAVANLTPLDWSTLDRPARPRWGEPLVTRGARSPDTAAYVIDTLALPFDNPYRALLFVSGFDFLPNGDLAVCVAHGDVWLVRGVDEGLEHLEWRRFATGLFQPLGLKVVDGVIHVLGRDQITRLHDVNGDGEADHYENFCSGYETSPGGHDYVTCLETDSHGAWYFVHANQGLVRVSPDGRIVETVATGFRNPNGLGIGPHDEITVAPQEGEWTPASAIFETRPGGHYGYLGPKPGPSRPLGYDVPLCWIPRAVDNSSGGQVWATSDRWGPLSGLMIHLSFGQCRALPVLRETVDGVAQGATVAWPLNFESGVCRGRMNPRDGQLYVGGLKGWVTSATQDGSLQRVRYTGKPAGMPVSLTTFANGLTVQFSEPVDPVTGTDPDNYRVQRWDYRYGKEYGSAEYVDVARGIEGRVTVEVVSATQSADGRSVFLEVPELRPAMQYAVTGQLARADGEPLKFAMYPTIHRVPLNAVPETQITRRARPGRLAPEVMARLQPGVRLQFTQAGQTDERVGRLAAWHVPVDEAPSLRLAPGPFHVRATGWLQTPTREKLRFRVSGQGAAKLMIADQPVWNGTGSLASVAATEIELTTGYHPFVLEFDSPPDAAATARWLWSSDSFAEEPVPSTVLWHDSGADSLQASLRWREGHWLFRERHCANCHGTETAEPDGPSLANLSQRITPAWLTTWLQNPHALRHDATMPRLFADDVRGRQSVADVAKYLLSLPPVQSVHREGEAPAEPRTTNDVRSQNGSAGVSPSLAVQSTAPPAGEALWEDLGCIGCHRFTAPSQLDSFDRVSLHATAGKFISGQLAAFLQRPQTHWPQVRMPDFQLSDEEAGELAVWITRHSTGNPVLSNAWSTADSARGRKLFDELNCRRCHRLDDQPAPTTSFAVKTMERGCLAETISPGQRAPVFALKAEQRTALQTYLAEPRRLVPSPPSSGERVRGSASERHPHPNPQKTVGEGTGGNNLSVAVEDAARLMHRLNCRGCHHRDLQLSPRGELIADESERGIPPEAWPNLTWAGEKLHAHWLRPFLAGELPARPRPWLKGRMPAFPAHAATLARGLLHEHGWGETPAPSVAVDANTVEAGRKLTLALGGLDCRQCHGINGELPAGDEKTRLARGIDFLVLRDRMRDEHYLRFVLDPPRFDIATRMPKLAVDGRTTKVTSIYDGDARRQFEAIWQYLHTLPK